LSTCPSLSTPFQWTPLPSLAPLYRRNHLPPYQPFIHQFGGGKSLPTFTGSFRSHPP